MHIGDCHLIKRIDHHKNTVNKNISPKCDFDPLRCAVFPAYKSHRIIIVEKQHQIHKCKGQRTADRFDDQITRCQIECISTDHQEIHQHGNAKLFGTLCSFSI